jgi:hypothetical protein
MFAEQIPDNIELLPELRILKELAGPAIEDFDRDALRRRRQKMLISHGINFAYALAKP